MSTELPRIEAALTDEHLDRVNLHLQILEARKAHYEAALKAHLSSSDVAENPKLAEARSKISEAERVSLILHPFTQKLRAGGVVRLLPLPPRNEKGLQIPIEGVTWYYPALNPQDDKKFDDRGFDALSHLSLAILGSEDYSPIVEEINNGRFIEFSYAKV